MNFIVGVQVYLEKPGTDEYPLVLAESSVDRVALDPGETQTSHELAQLAAQIHAEEVREMLGWTIKKDVVDGKPVWRKTVKGAAKKEKN
jgi:hypothetical protein